MLHCHAPSLLLSAVLASLCPQASQPSPTDLVDHWMVRALDSETGQPLAGLAVWGTYDFGTLLDAEYALADAVTDRAGFARIDLSALAGLHPIERETVELKATFTGQGFQTDDMRVSFLNVTDGPDEDDDGLAEYERDLFLDRGACLVGRVVDAAGNHVSRAVFDAGVYDANTERFEPEVSGSNFQFLTDPKGRFSLDLEASGAFDIYAYHRDYGAGCLSLDTEAIERAREHGLTVELDPRHEPLVSIDEFEPPLSFQFPSGYRGFVSDDAFEAPPRDHLAMTVASPGGHPIRGAHIRCAYLRSPDRVGAFERSSRHKWLPSPIDDASFWVAANPENLPVLVTAEIVTRDGHWWAESLLQDLAGKGATRASLPLRWKSNEDRRADVSFQFVDADGVPVPRWRGAAESLRTGRTLFDHTERGTYLAGASHGDTYSETHWEAGPTRLVTHTHPSRFELPVETLVDLPSDRPTELQVRSPGYGGRLQLNVPTESRFPGGEFVVRFRRADGAVRQAFMERVVVQRGMPILWWVRGASRVRYDRDPSVLLPPGLWEFNIEGDAGSPIFDGTVSITEHRRTIFEIPWP